MALKSAHAIPSPCVTALPVTTEFVQGIGYLFSTNNKKWNNNSLLKLNEFEHVPTI